MSSIGIINHIEIYVSDLKATRRFWDLLLLENLGYTIHQKWETGVSYVLKDTYIVFVQSTHLMPAYNRTRVGLNHLAFSVSSIAQLDNIRDQLCQANYTELYADRYPHAAGDDTFALFFEDPDRIKVEVTYVSPFNMSDWQSWLSVAIIILLSYSLYDEIKHTSTSNQK